MARRDALLRLHKTLVARRTALRKVLAGELADLRNSQVDTGDSADVAFDAGSDEIATQLVELEARELSQIERALARIKQGIYGVCEGCQKKIPVARLNALPIFLRSANSPANTFRSAVRRATSVLCKRSKASRRAIVSPPL